MAELVLEGDWGRIAPADDQPRWVLRAGDAMVPAIEAAWGAPLAAMMLRARDDGARVSLRLGPDEWLLLGDGTALAEALAGQPASLVEVSDRNVGLDLSGPMIAAILNSGCPLDLGDAAFPTGMVTRTVFGKAEVVLWRRAEGWRLEVWRSFGDYVGRYLAQAVADL
jgi:sarcosine oxidase subunit gamma